MKKIDFLLFALVVASFVALPDGVSAHERQQFTIGDAAYLFTIGSLNEPITVDDKTGVDLRIVRLGDAHEAEEDNHTVGASANHAAEGTPVEGLGATLKVELIAGGKKKTLDLSPAYNDPGAYRAVFFPTIQTTYQYRVFGTINDVPVDLSFSCNPAGHPQSEEDKTSVKISDQVTRTLKVGAFGCPAVKSDLGFPEKSVTINELQQTITSDSARISGIESSSQLYMLIAAATGTIAILFSVTLLLKKRG